MMRKYINVNIVREFDSEESCIKHEKYCKAKNNCYRCGREGHYADDCYARIHVKGYYLNC